MFHFNRVNSILTKSISQSISLSISKSNATFKPSLSLLFFPQQNSNRLFSSFIITNRIVSSLISIPPSLSLSSSSSLMVLSKPTINSIRHYSPRIRTKVPRKLKTKKAMLKRCIITASGHMKIGRCGKSHLNRNKSPMQIMRLNKKKLLKGTMLKNMKSLILTGK